MTDFTNKDIEFGWISGENGWGDGMNENLQRVSNLLVASVLSAVIATPPVTPADGDGYLVPSGATGVWTTHVGDLAYWSALEADWLYFTPAEGWQVWSAANDGMYYYTGAAWQVLMLRVSGGVQLPGATLKLGTDASGTDVAATNETVIGPLSTGTGTPAAVIVQVGVQGASGSTVQTATEGFRVQEVVTGATRAIRAGVVSGGLFSGVPLDSAATLVASTSQVGSRFDITRDAAFAQFAGRRFNGTWQVPTAIVAGDVLMTFTGGGYDGTALVLSADVRFVADENFGASNLGTYIRLRAAQIGTTTIRNIADFRVSASTVSEMWAGLATFRIIPGATQLAIRDSGNTVDTFTINAAGTTITAPVATTITAALAALKVAGLATAISTKTSAYTITTGDSLILADATAGAFSVTLPTAASASGSIFVVKKIDVSVNAVTIDPNGAELIDGAATRAVTAQYESVMFQSNGTAWYII